jgi:C4-dicarboxylate-specific signal transduction histidine kinase
VQQVVNEVHYIKSAPGFSLIFFALNHSVENSISLVIIASLFFLANGLRAYALRLDMGEHYAPVLLWGIFILMVTLYAYVTLVLENTALRAGLMSSISLVLYGVIAWSAYRIGKKEHSVNAYLISGVYFMVIAAMLFRLIEIISVQRGVNLLENDASQMLLVLSIVMSAVIGHVSFIGLMFERNKKNEIHYQTEKARQEEAYRLNRQIMHLDRQRSLGMVAMSFSHELNQPLNSIFLSSEVALRGLRQHHLSEAQHLELLERVVVNVHRAKDILQRLGDHIKPSSTQYQPIELRRLAEEVCYLLQPVTMAQDIEIELFPDPSALLVKGESLALSQVLLNVIRNAIESVQGQDLRLIQVSLKRSDDKVSLVVEDSGGGFSEAVLAQIGRAFLTTKTDGLGVGICISQTIVQYHLGQMYFENIMSPDGTRVMGARVSIQLPEWVKAK